MGTVFTDHIRSLNENPQLDDVLAALQSGLRAELKRRGLNHESPKLLGYVGNNWKGSDPMEDLVHDCYVFAIIRRLPGLQNQLKRRDNVDGCVRLNIRNFVTERQKQSGRRGRAGYALFQNLKAVLLTIRAEGFVEIDPLGDGCKIESASIVRRPGFDGQAASDDDLRETISATGVLFDNLEQIVRIGEQSQRILSEVLREALSNSLSAFGVRSLVGVLKQLVEDARISLADGTDNSWESVDEEFCELVRTVGPDTSYEEAEGAKRATQRLSKDIDSLQRSPAVCDRLKRILDCIVRTIDEGDETERLTYARIGSELGIARSTLHDDMKLLRCLAERQTNPNLDTSG